MLAKCRIPSATEAVCQFGLLPRAEEVILIGVSNGKTVNDG
jgi:hypothetical protein